jgi:hypothetical protein
MGFHAYAEMTFSITGWASDQNKSSARERSRAAGSGGALLQQAQQPPPRQGDCFISILMISTVLDCLG